MNALVIGDSFSANGAQPQMWHYILGTRLNKMFHCRASGGTGYLAKGDGLPNRFSRQMMHRPDITTPRTNIDLVIFFGSPNDRFIIPGQSDLYRQMVFNTLLEARSQYPNAKQLVIAPQWCSSDPKPTALDVMAGLIADEMWGQNFDYQMLQPNLGTDTTKWWFPPNRSDLRDTDNFHPSQGGQTHLANILEPHVRSMLNL